jgi:hypothetical protein
MKSRDRDLYLGANPEEVEVDCIEPIPLARSKAWAFGRALAGILGSNPTGGLGVCLLCVCVVR